MKTNFKWIAFTAPSIAWFSSESHELVEEFDNSNAEFLDAAIRWYVTAGSLALTPTTVWYSITQAFWWREIWTVSYNLKTLNEAKLYKDWLEKLMWLRDVNQIVSFETWRASLVEEKSADFDDEDLNTEIKVEPMREVENTEVDERRVWRLNKIKELQEKAEKSWGLWKYHNEFLVSKLKSKEASEVDFLDLNLSPSRKEELIKWIVDRDPAILNTLKAEEIDAECFKRYLWNIWLDTSTVETDENTLLAIFKASYVKNFW